MSEMDFETLDFFQQSGKFWSRPFGLIYSSVQHMDDGLSLCLCNAKVRMVNLSGTTYLVPGFRKIILYNSCQNIIASVSSFIEWLYASHKTHNLLQ